MSSPTDQPNDEPSGRNMTDAPEGVVIPEEFQQAVHGVLKKATTKHHLNHIRDRVYAKEDEMRKSEEAKKSKNGSKGKVENFSAEMPGSPI
jgi:hypothetical protein